MAKLHQSSHRYLVKIKVPLPDRTYIYKEKTVDAYSESAAKAKAKRHFDSSGWYRHEIVSVSDLTPRRK